ncbi:hypothetical protein GCM10010493_71830 [Streptomyces lavendulae subsp. grasserius]
MRALSSRESAATVRRLTVPGGAVWAVPGPRLGHVYVVLMGVPPDGLLLDVAGWPVRQVVDGALLMSDHRAFGPGGRSDCESAEGGSGDVGRFVWRGDVP